MLLTCGLKRWLVLMIGALVLTGCGKRGNARSLAEERLYKIGKAYIQSCYRLERGPESFSEIKPNIEGDVPDELLVSPNDGENFVILWGVDFSQLPSPAKDPFIVGGYEKKGVGGSRYVLRFPLQTLRMNDEAFGEAGFPPGHKAPQ